MVDTAAKQNTAAKTTSRPLRRLFHGDKTMLYLVKIRGAGEWRLPFPSTKAAFAWAEIVFPCCPPPAVICLNREVAA